MLFKEALSDIEVCRKLEEYIGREQVVALIDAAAGMNLTFSDYPRTADFILNLMEQIAQAIKNTAKTRYFPRKVPSRLTVSSSFCPSFLTGSSDMLSTLLPLSISLLRSILCRLYRKYAKKGL